jgi:DNA helicase-2/ATP-dependent DNA helicase PcrA
MKLSKQQKEAVSFDQNICVVACPGSGKTRTIVAKLLKCLEEVRNTARRIACITYTNAAVDEIEKRLRQYGSIGDDDYYEVGTIHSFCLTNILQPFHYLLPELKLGFRVIAPDSDEWQSLILDLAQEYGVDRRRLDSFANIHRRPNHTVFIPPEIPDEAAMKLISHLDSNSLVSFPDIVYHSSRLIEQIFISRGLGCHFAWMLIDEFQDTSDGQVAILSAIASHKKTKFFLVGDPNQSIMAFAGAHPKLMQIFPAKIGARTDLRLYGNYRSSQRIVSHAERLIPTIPPMCAVGDLKDYPVEPERFHVEDRTTGIFNYFLPTVESLNIHLGDAVVLAPWWIPLYHLGRDLRERSVPVIGPGARPYRGRRLFASFAEHLCAYTEDGSPDLFRSSQRALFLMLLNITAKPQWQVFSYDGRRCLCRIAALSKEISDEFKTEAVKWLRAVSNQITILLVKNEFMPINMSNVIRDSCDDMISDMEVNHIDLDNLSISDLGLYARPRDCLHLITMHSSKGREFDAVAIIDLHDGRVPDFRCTTQEQCDEARRQFYVSITRARKLLMYFTDYSDYRNRPTRFLSEMGL